MKRIVGETMFFFHAVFVIFWIGLFFVPESLFPSRVSFHFYLSLLVVSHQVLWGLWLMRWTGKFRMVCIFTTITQILRGESISDPKNYDHSFNREFLGKTGINISNRVSAYITFGIVALSSFQYLLNF